MESTEDRSLSQNYVYNLFFQIVRPLLLLAILSFLIQIDYFSNKIAPLSEKQNCFLGVFYVPPRKYNFRDGFAAHVGQYGPTLAQLGAQLY